MICVVYCCLLLVPESGEGITKEYHTLQQAVGYAAAEFRLLFLLYVYHVLAPLLASLLSAANTTNIAGCAMALRRAES